MADKALVSVVQKEVVFYEDVVTAVLVKTETVQEIYVPIRPICDYSRVGWPAQYRLVIHDIILNQSIHGVAIKATPSLDCCATMTRSRGIYRE